MEVQILMFLFCLCSWFLCYYCEPLYFFLLLLWARSKQNSIKKQDKCESKKKVSSGTVNSKSNKQNNNEASLKT